MSLRSQLSGPEHRKVVNQVEILSTSFSVTNGVPRGILIKTNKFQYFHRIPMIFNKIHGFPGFLMGAPGALEISRRREIAPWSKFPGSDHLPGG